MWARPAAPVSCSWHVSLLGLAFPSASLEQPRPGLDVSELSVPRSPPGPPPTSPSLFTTSPSFVVRSSLLSPVEVAHPLAHFLGQPLARRAAGQRPEFPGQVCLVKVAAGRGQVGQAVS